MPTLLEVLQRKNPDITDQWAGSSYGNTSSLRFDHVTLDDGCRVHVQVWKDFTFNAIYLAYGDILKQPLDPRYTEAQSPSDTQTSIIDENGIDTLGAVWSCSIEGGPLKMAGAILRKRPGMAMATLAGEPNPTLALKKISWKHLAGQGASMNPDWAVLDSALFKKYGHAHEKDPAKCLVYAVGDSKLKQKWKSVWLTYRDSDCVVNLDPPYHGPGTLVVPAPSKTKEVREERIKPLKQLATYCRYGETRYGYLVTQTELVAMRVRRIPGAEKHHAAIEYHAIPWSAHGHNQLTAHLAIWALGCMGMNDFHRAMEGPSNTVLPGMAKLTWWKENKSRNTFTNVISRRVLSAEAWARVRATPGGAAFQTDDASGMSPTSAFTVHLRPAGAVAGAAGAHGKTYTKCTIGKTTFNLTRNPRGSYLILDCRGRPMYTLGRRPTGDRSWFVKEDSNLIVVKVE